MRPNLPKPPSLASLFKGLGKAHPAPFGVGGGGTSAPINAILSGINGRVQALTQGSQAQNDDVAQPLQQSLYLPAGTQARTGSTARLLEQLFVDVAVVGTLPEGMDAAALRSFLIGSTFIEPRIGGVPQLQIPLGACVDTRTLDRSFGMRARLNLGDFQSLVFVWSSDALLLPLAESKDAAEYTVSLTILAGFSAPLLK